jgi:hypothetical protein
MQRHSFFGSMVRRIEALAVAGGLSKIPALVNAASGSAPPSTF